MATIKSEYYRFNGVSWDIHYFKTTMDMVDGLNAALGNKLDKRTGIIQSEAMTPDTQALFPYALTTASTAIGMEYNILLYAWRKGYTITQSGSGQIASQNGLFDGKLEPQYSPDGIDPANPFVLLIEGLPNIHSQTGGMIGWTARYWFPSRYKVETYDSYISQWRTLLDQSSTAKPTKDLVIPLYPTYSGAHTKIRITIYEAGGTAGANGFKRWGLSEIFFIHPEAQAVHQYLDVEWAKKLSSARAIQIGNTSKNFDGSSNIAWSLSEIGIARPVPGAYFGDKTPVIGADGVMEVGKYIDFHEQSDDTDDYDGRLYVVGTVLNYEPRGSTAKAIALLSNLNQTLEMGGTTQYIRLAYAGKSQAFIKHGGGTEYEVWTTGNFNPSDYMPKSGGTFTGPVSFTGLTSFEILHIDTMYVNSITSDGGSISFGGVDNINFDLALLRNVADPIAAGDAVNKSYVDTYKAPKASPIFTTAGAEFAIGDVANKNRVQSYASGIPIRFLNSVNGYADIAVGELYLGGSRGVGAELDNVLNVGNPTMKFNTSTAYTLILADKGTSIFTQAAGATTITIPTHASVAFPNGTEINVVRYNSQEVTIGYASGVTIYSEGSSAGNAGKRRINAEYQAVTLKKISTNVWIVIGALKS